MRKTSFITVCVLMLGLLAALPAAATTQDSGTLNFQTSDQSMWGPGPAFNFSASPTLFDLSLNGSASPSIGCFSFSFPSCVTVTGAGLTASTSGDFGVGANLNVNGGTVSATVPVNVTLGFPSLVPNATPFNITSSGMFGVGTLSTASPSIQASASTFGSLSASLTGQACLVGLCASGTIVSVGPLNLGTQLFSINSATSPLNTTINLAPGVDLNVGVPFVATAGAAGPQGFPPPLSISSSGGPSNFLGLNANLTNLVASALGLPPLSASGSLGPVSWSYNLLTISAGLNLGATQAFNLSATPLVAYNVTEFGANAQNFTTAPMAVGTPFSLSLPGGVTMADITPTYFLAAGLMNNTNLALSASAALTALGASLDSLSVGPLINLNTSFPIANFNVFNSTFDLGGWNTIQGQTFQITATPEPGSFLLLGTGILALARRLRRRSLKA
jgi:PEP-CTERM motif-containing protein